ncbi:hypothetical protein G6F46_005156 [Rhizopus delemar]|nr:hypothetical protein G6F43_001379 [Rhizopus delemar]KAG1545672.1 hypothetical protein G6F51_005325 [Rhizopus arrhizus]KAG1460996.1 hypothetical protein G6F55_003828 [Rhizopus delemar]KAG1499320.1 hypothetical protein G6F54_004484 [Rhizopus delemar]KAG1513112.1 hypothetical protein G6F53_004673 [Rhizopus delemar]
MKKFRLKQEPFDRTGLLFSLTGFLLILLCLIGCQTPGSKGLYFAKVTDASQSGMVAYYGWRGYCIEDKGITCYKDDGVLVVPLDVSISDNLNITYPQLFKDEIAQDENLNPGAAANPPHDPKIYPAAVICLICSGTLLVLAIYRVYRPQQYQDEHYTRGFLAAASTVLALLLVALSSVMYQNATEQLNETYPHLVASQGPCMILLGVAFASFFLASIALLRGVMRIDSDPEGYSAI